MDWLGSSEVIHVGIGCKVLSLILNEDKVIGFWPFLLLPMFIWPIFPLLSFAQVSLEVAGKRYPGKTKFLKRPLELIDEDEVNAQYGVAISYGLQLLRSLYSKDSQLVKTSVRADKLANLLLHSCVNVRQEAVKLFAQVLVAASSNEDEFDLQWIDMKVMKQVRYIRNCTLS